MVKLCDPLRVACRPGATVMPRAMSADEIVEDLADRIKQGQYPPDTRLPTYEQLARLYSVSPATIGTVIKLLKAKKLVYGVAGKGVFVEASAAPAPVKPPVVRDPFGRRSG